MTGHTALLTATVRRPREDADGTAVTAGWETGGSGNANGPVPSHDGALDDALGHRPGKIAVTRQSASHIAVRAGLSQADQYRVLALAYPVEYQVFWQVLADTGVTQEYLMDRMGASP